MRVKAKGAFGTSISDDVTLCNIPYAEDNLTMTFLMPQNLCEFEAHMSREGLQELFSRIRLQRGDVTLAMPKFKMEKRWNLKQTFSQLGFGDLFDSARKHDYSGLTDEDIFIGDAVHSATIEVDY